MDDLFAPLVPEPTTTRPHLKRRWVLDKRTAACFLCESAFTVLNRRHHCRSCGNVICAACSPKEVILADFNRPVRVCTACYTSRGPRRSISFATSGLDADDSDNNPDAVGRLYVAVIEAVGLAVADPTGTSDPYATITLTGHSSHGQEWRPELRQTYRTAVKQRTLNPQWEEMFVFDVPHSRAELKVQVFDHDLLVKDDALGSVSVPLSALLDQRKHSVWYDLLPPNATATAPTTSTDDAQTDANSVTPSPTIDHLSGRPSAHHMRRFLAEPVVGTRVETPARSPGGATPPPASHHLYDDSDYMDNYNPHTAEASGAYGAGRIHLQLLYKFSRAKEFSSYFHDPDEYIPVWPPLEVNLLYHNFWHFMDLLWPYVAFIWSIQAVLYWKHPLASAIWLFAIVVLAVNITWVPVVLHLAFLLKLATRALNAFLPTWAQPTTAQPTPAQPAEIDPVPSEYGTPPSTPTRSERGDREPHASPAASTPASIPATPVPGKRVAESSSGSVYHVNTIVNTLGTIVLQLFTREGLRKTQNYLAWINSILQSLDWLCSWESPVYTGVLTVIVCISCVVHIFLPNVYPLLLLIFFLFWRWTHSYRAFMHFIVALTAGLRSLYTQYQASKQAAIPKSATGLAHRPPVLHIKPTRIQGTSGTREDSSPSTRVTAAVSSLLSPVFAVFKPSSPHSR